MLTSFLSPFGRSPRELIAHRLLEALETRDAGDLGEALDEARGERILPDRDLDDLEGLRDDRARFEAEAVFMPREAQTDTEEALQLRSIELAYRLFGFIPASLVSPRLRLRLAPELREAFESGLQASESSPPEPAPRAAAAEGEAGPEPDMGQ